MKNYSSSSGDIEAAVAEHIFGRRLEKKLRYTVFISDGDSSAYNAVCKMNEGKGPYGGIIIEKAECTLVATLNRCVSCDTIICFSPPFEGFTSFSLAMFLYFVVLGIVCSSIRHGKGKNCNNLQGTTGPRVRKI